MFCKLTFFSISNRAVQSVNLSCLCNAHKHKLRVKYSGIWGHTDTRRKIYKYQSFYSSWVQPFKYENLCVVYENYSSLQEFSCIFYLYHMLFISNTQPTEFEQQYYSEIILKKSKCKL